MTKTSVKLYRQIEKNLTEKKFLKKIGLTRKKVMTLLSENQWKQKAADIEVIVQEDSGPDCSTVLSMMKDTVEMFSPTPEEGWLSYIYKETIAEMFPENYELHTEREQFYKGRLFFMEVLRTVFKYQEEVNGFSPTEHMEVLTDEQIGSNSAGAEYRKFREYWDQYYLLEFMRIGKEITPYNTLGHICGVHFIALHVAKQLVQAGAPVDLALVSGAAAGHDLGKYGCKGAESRRIPYLHYYYTDQLMKRNGMPMIAHIASNHSTWDLELENLSVESLLLIYADFRVKSTRNSEGVEIVHFYSLDEAFSVILGKLDNVDDTKKRRYRKVYAKLKDFEQYMIRLGVSTETDKEWHQPEGEKDVALLGSQEVVDKFKYLAVDHNIRLMNKFNNQAAFGNLIEAARSEKFWKNLRAYMNILDEYSTYMTKSQKEMTLYFLYDILSNKEGDIRRQAAVLMGKIITNYDEEYRKELPAGVMPETAGVTSFSLCRFYMGKIIFPDHKVTEQHKSWIGYTLKILFSSIMEHAAEEDKREYLGIYLTFFEKKIPDTTAVFVLLDSMLNIPLKMCTDDEKRRLMAFAAEAAAGSARELRIGALRFVNYLSENESASWIRTGATDIIKQTDEDDAACIVYLHHKIRTNLGISDNETERYRKMIEHQEESSSDIFLENLKVDTPWVVKAVNIEFLLEEVKAGRITEVLHVATHLSNLLKVSERITLRHAAGRGLLEVVKMLPLDQRNELVIELTRGLEIGEYEYSKYIPGYLGVLALYLHPNELDELLGEFRSLMENTNEKVVSVTLDTIGEVLKHFPEYQQRFEQTQEEYDHRKEILLGMLLRGLANYNEAVSQEAVRVIGQHIFGSPMLSLERKKNIFCRTGKKMLTLIMDQREQQLTFFTNAAALNHIYRFISEYILVYGKVDLPEENKIAFFPGTFDPFSLSHKGIVKSIRDLGFEVYLALDEFSWSKKTQPRMIRRRIINMSVADEVNVYLFPDDEPVNIANPGDLKKLKSLLPDKELYIVVGSDVVINASSYKAAPEDHSIHTLNHLVFRRESAVEGEVKNEDLSEYYKRITGKVVELTLPVHLEDISSTRIRENIDNNRDISNLIDTVAQNYIYENSLYLREPQYKHIMQTKTIHFEPLQHRGGSMRHELELLAHGSKHSADNIRRYLEQPDVRATLIRDGEQDNRICGLAAMKEVNASGLYEEFRNAELAAYLRKKATGRIMVLGGIYYDNETEIRDIVQLILTETLSQALEEDFTYAVYHHQGEGSPDINVLKALEHQGFREIIIDEDPTGIYEVDMKSPVAVFQNMETVLKDPFDKSEKVLDAIRKSHAELQMALTRMYPGSLVLSFNSGVMHHKLINMITRDNGVPSEPTKVRSLGPYMCVPFGKILRGMAVPNTVTKTIHTEKRFEPDLKGFSVEEYPNYSPIANQVKTIKSFDRPVLLVDDLLHKGYRMKELDPVLKENNVEVKKLVVGLLSGSGRDLMTIQGRDVDCAYFIPDLKSWFVESSLYPFIGGDGVKRKDRSDSGLQASINMILPYVAPSFLSDEPNEAVYNFSMVCLKNARRIFLALEEEYQNRFQRKLTLNRLSEVVISPCVPDMGSFMTYDMNLAPSGYLLNGIERLIRLENIIV